MSNITQKFKYSYMKHHRFYQNITFTPNQTLALTSEVASHISRVLRLRVGTLICLFDGKNQECTAEITALSKRDVSVRIIDLQHISRESSFQIVLAQAISKGERFDLVVQKAVELGVTHFVPILSERNVVKLDDARQQKKLAHWQGIIESAAEQCGRNQLMQLSPIMPLDKFLSSKMATTICYLHPKASQNLSQLNKPNDIAFIIGPEGGFSDQECAQMSSSGAVEIKLGPRILRTETAGIVTCGLAQNLWGDLG